MSSSKRLEILYACKMLAPTLRTGVSSLPPVGALAALGRPGGGSDSVGEGLGTTIRTSNSSGAITFWR